MIGVLGGTFDPIHYGHLRPAAEASRRLGLDLLRVIPASDPPHRHRPVARAEQRLRMVELAIPEFPGFIADDRELRRAGPSYTVPTLESLRAEIGDMPLCLLLGVDAFLGLHTWHQWTRLPELAHLVVLSRPGWPLPLPEALPEWARARLDDVAALRTLPAGRLVLLEGASLDISATRIRDMIARGESPPADWLPAPVWSYIRSHGIYRSQAA